jgi:hypothetical protein
MGDGVKFFLGGIAEEIGAESREKGEIQGNITL